MLVPNAEDWFGLVDVPLLVEFPFAAVESDDPEFFWSPVRVLDMPSAEPKGKGEYGDCLGCDEDPSPLMSMMRSTELLTKKMIQLLYSSILSNCNKNFPCGSSTLRGQNSWWPSRPKHVSKMAKIPMAIFFSSHLVQIWLKVTSVFSDNCSKFEFSRQHFLKDVVELMDQC